MIYSTEKQNKIIRWLIATPFVKKVNEIDYLILPGKIVELESETYVDLYKWLGHEGFRDCSTVAGFYFKVEEEETESKTRVKMLYLRKADCLAAPFAASGSTDDDPFGVKISSTDSTPWDSNDDENQDDPRF